MKILGIFHSGFDPSAALLIDDRVVAYVEEERLIRDKHAKGRFPTRSIDYVLEAGGVEIADIDYLAQAWDCQKYDNGVVAKHYEEINKRYPTNSEDIAYQNSHLNTFRSERQKGIILQNLRRQYGEIAFPDLKFVHHHFAHACTAYFCSGMEESLVLTIDGSGEEITTAWWIGKDEKLTLLKEIKVPHSLGWLYSAFTEYLGFQAYDGEYKVMGLAAFGEHDKEIKSKIDKLIRYDGEGGFESDPLILARGPRKFSSYYPDALPKHLGRPPRAEKQVIDKWHKDCAFVVQQTLEEIVQEMARYWIEKTGVRNLCISGGVGLNVKMNGNIYASGLVDDLFVYPLCSDAGQSIGAAMALRYELRGLKNVKISHLLLGPEYTDEEIKRILSNCKIEFSEEESIEKKVAELISEGAIVGWFQGRMEGGPRALGARSILADPRNVKSRDKVNEVIKYRELWRPFCPSMTAEGAEMYFDKYTDAPFMIMTFGANEKAEKEVPAIVHVDKTSRPHIVERNGNERYYDLIQEFKNLTGIPVLLNTSFNVKGEPIVCTPQDALRTFSATGLDVLAIGNCLVTKSNL